MGTGMSVEVALVLRTQLDQRAFLGLSNKLLGYSPAARADAVTPQLKPVPHELACLLGFKDRAASPALEATEQFHDFFSFGFLVGADERDMPAILEAAKMPFVLQETIVRGVQVAIVVGTFRQWKCAVRRSCTPTADQMVRLCFDKVYLAFESLGLAKAFGTGRPKPMNDTTFFLEDNRGR